MNRNGAWLSASVPMTAFAGQAIRIVIAATDGGRNKLVVAQVDDIRILRY